MFTLDIAVALIITILLLLVAHYYMNKTNIEALSKVEMVRTGSDIMAILDNEGTLATLNGTYIEERMNTLLPVNYDMRIVLYCTNMATGTLRQLPRRKAIVTGRRIIVAPTTFCTAMYWVWSK